MTVDTLKTRTKRELARMARDLGVARWHALRKEELILALCEEKPAATATTARPASPPTARPRNGDLRANGEAHRPAVPAPTSENGHANGHAHAPARPHSNGNGNGHANGHAPARTGLRPEAAAALAAVSASAQHAANSRHQLNHNCEKDRIITLVRDPFWLHCYWELTRSTLDRAKAAMGQDWHSARPILRLMDVTSEETTTVGERHARDIEIHGEVNNWYIDVPSPARSFRVDIGYLARSGRFYILSRSNVVTTPKTRISDGSSNGMRPLGLPSPADYDRDSSIPREFREAFEAQQRSFQPFSFQGLGTGAIPSFGRDFHFHIDAELVVYGRTEPNAKVTLQGESVKLQPDGSFSVRFALPDSRQIIPAVAASPDGVEERTIVLAVERNTKTLEPQIHDGNDL